MAMSCKDGKQPLNMDNGKYVRYTPEQVEALERLYHDCPKPSSIRRHQLIRECPILSNIEPKQIKVWFQNRRCREKQRKEASRLQAVNRKLTAMNKLLMEENDRLQKQVSQLVYENGYFRQHTHNTPLATKDTSCESVVTSGQHHLTPQHPPRDASPAGLLSIAEETLTEFLSKATGTAIEWVQMPGMKPGPDSSGIVAISHGCTGVGARACGLVGLEPTRVAEILKDRPLWFRDCRAVDVLNVLPTANGGTIELLYMQLYAPTTLAPGRDFWLLRYTSVLEDGSLVVCERSLKNTQNGPSMPPVQHFVRAEMLPSGYLVRPCEGGGSIIHVVDHMDLEPWSVPEVLRPLYESSTALAQKTTMAALRHLRQIAQEASQSNVTNWGRRPAALRALSQRLSRGFNEALNGFSDEGWSMIGNDGMDDVTILVNSSPDKLMGSNLSFTNGFSAVNSAVLCAKASMLLQNVPPAILLRFLREHRSEWADNNIDAYAAAAVKVGPFSLQGSRVGSSGGQVILPLAHTIEHEEFLEVIKLEGVSHSPEDPMMPRDVFLLQLCCGMDENAVGTCAELIFAPIDATFADDAPLLPSGFRIIPLDSGKEASSPNRTLDLAAALEVGPVGNKASGDHSANSGCTRSVMTIAFEFAFESHMQEHVAAMTRQYIRSIISSVQRVALALSPHLGSQAGLRSPLGTPEAQTLARWICQSYRSYLGVELLKSNGEGSESILKTLWHHSDAIMCCSLKALPIFTFANQAGLDMLETTLVALQDITLEKIFDDHGRKAEFHDSSSKQSIDTTPKSAKYISIILPRSVLSTNHENNTSIEELVLTDTAKAFDKLKQIKGSRLRIFDRYEDALNCSLEGIDDLQLIPEPPKEKIAENFPTPSPPELCKLRKAIECGDFDLVYSLITENPKYVITSSDTPVILMEGPRFNGVHIACRCNQIEILEFILKTINNPDFIKKLYPNDSDAVTEETRKHLLDLYLNTPDKAALDTPLHFASKFAAADCVKLLLTYPGCDRERRNKFGETPYDVICSRKRDSQAYEKIKEYFEARFYISIMRKYDRVTVCTPSETPPKDDSISGIAGPMSPKLAEEIYSKLKSPAKSTSPRKFNIRLTDGSRGVERVARMECRYHNLDWVEYWPFLNCYVDLASPEGLEMLEKHLAKMHGLASKQPNGEESSSDKTHEKSSVSLLCDRLGLLSLASNQSIDGELIKSQEVNSSDDDDDYVTPPSSPVQVDFFVNGKSFSQSDKDAANALADIKINAFRFPYTAQWLRKVKREKSMTSPSEETFVNFCDKVAANIAHSTPRKSINLIDLISPRRFHGLSDQQSSTEISGDDDVFHESFR